MRIVNVLLGAIVGLAFWYYVTPLYAQAAKSLAALAVPALFGRGYQLGGTDDPLLYTPAGLIAAHVFMRFVETNVITLIALFAFARRPLTASNLGRCAIGLLFLIPVHAAAILVIAKSLTTPPGSLWRNAGQAYAIFGCHAISFALWSLLSTAESAPEPAPSSHRKGRHPAR
jgi:hypothetical protein